MSRKPTEQERKLHKSLLAAPGAEASAKDIASIIPDANTRQSALNFLLRVGLLKSLTDKKGNLSFRAVSGDELKRTKNLTDDEKLVLGHIKASQNEGLWTKHLKAKTNLHQTVIDRCLKTLTQQKLIKRVASVQYPTRKIYMLEEFEPSVAMTGGPWYTDNELDTEFIATLIKACYKVIRDLSFPRRNPDLNETLLFPISYSPQYPTAQQVRNTLKKARLTPTELSVEHVEMLLNVLVLDGEVERIPAFGGSTWNTSALDESEEDEDSPPKKKKKRKHRSSSDSEAESKHRKKRRKHARSEPEDDSEDSPPRKKNKKKRSHGSSDDASDDKRSSKRKKKHRKDSSSSAESSSDTQQSGSDSKEDEKSRKKKASRRSPSLPAGFMFDDEDSSEAYVYRAIRHEQLSLGWSQAPCSICPSFEFCKTGGPVNPRDCVYYGDWLVGGVVADIEDVEI